MKGKICLSIIGLIMIQNVNAQVSFGIRTGVNFAKWQGEDLQVIEDLIEKTDG